MTFLYQLINGLQVGSIYALIALGYSMVYGIVKLINFAHGDLIMIGAYAALISMSTFLPLWVTILLCIVVTVIFGVMIERFAYRPLRRHNAPRISLLITALGVSMLLENGVSLIFSPSPRPFPTILDLPPIVIGSVQISMITVSTVVVSILVMIVLMLLVHKTKMGKAMRAVSEDSEAAQLMGINVNTTISFTFALGSALASVSALFYCMAYPQIQPYMGSMLGLKAFVAAVLGGIGSVPGAMLGGLLLGIAEAMTKGFVTSKLTDAVVFGILIVVLLVKPSGILGQNVREKV